MRHLLTALVTGALLSGVAHAQGFVPLSPEESAPATPSILIDLRDDITPDQLQTLTQRHGIELTFNSEYSHRAQLMRVDELHGRDIERLIEALESEPLVENVELEQTYQAIFEPDDPLYKYQWHLQQVKMPDAWELSSGRGAVVAVIDTGVAYEDYQDKLGKYHQVEDLKGVSFVPGYDFVNNDAHANDDHCHGTHVAGTIAQATNNGVGVAGMAFKASIMPIKVLSAQGYGKTGDIADAIRFAADHGAHVINMSLGGPFPSKILRDAIHYAHKKGVVVVAAAGNNGQRKVSYPAAYPDTVAVSATRFDKTLTWYSNWGAEIDVAAPGGDTRVDQNGDGQPDGVMQNTIAVGDPTTEGYYLFQGTSMASPHVAGAAALVIAQGVTDPDKVEAILKATAQKQGSGDFDEKYGYGIIDAATAVSKASQSERNSSLFGVGLLVAALALLRLPLRGLSVAFGAGALLGSAGLLFPWRDAFPGPFGVLTHGMPAWGGVLFGANWFGSVLLMSALLPIAGVALLYGRRNLRSLLAGLSLGFAAYMLGQAYLGNIDVAMIPNWLGSTLDRSWLILNALIAFFLSAVLLRSVARR